MNTRRTAVYGRELISLVADGLAYQSLKEGHSMSTLGLSPLAAIAETGFVESTI